MPDPELAEHMEVLSFNPLHIYWRIIVGLWNKGCALKLIQRGCEKLKLVDVIINANKIHFYTKKTKTKNKKRNINLWTDHEGVFVFFCLVWTCYTVSRIHQGILSLITHPSVTNDRHLFQHEDHWKKIKSNPLPVKNTSLVLRRNNICKDHYHLKWLVKMVIVCREV